MPSSSLSREFAFDAKMYTMARMGQKPLSFISLKGLAQGRAQYPFILQLHETGDLLSILIQNQGGNAADMAGQGKIWQIVPVVCGKLANPLL